MSRCPKCGRTVIDLARNEEGDVIDCRHCYEENLSRNTYGRSEECEREDRELTRASHDAGLSGSEEL